MYMKDYNFKSREELLGNISRNIVKYRKLKSMTAAKLAESIGKSHEYIRTFETNPLKAGMTIETLNKVALVLEVSTDDLQKG